MYVQAAASLAYIRQITRVTCQLVDSPFTVVVSGRFNQVGYGVVAFIFRNSSIRITYKWGIYQLTCNTCNLSFVGQTSCSLNIWFQEHIRYIRYNNPLSAYTLHILQNQHEYSQMNSTMTLLKPLNNPNLLLPYEQYHIQALHHNRKLIPEQSLGDTNPLFQAVINL